MKNSTVALMVRNQFNIDPSIKIDVDCLYGTSTTYMFKINWFDDDSGKCEVVVELPHLEVKTHMY